VSFITVLLQYYVLKINPEEIIHTYQTPIKLFHQGIKADATRLDYTNKLKKIVCEFLENILVGNPEKVRQALSKPKPKGLVNGKQREFCDADFEERVNEFVKKSKADQDWAEDIVLKLVEKLCDRTQLPRTNPEYLAVSSINNYVRPIQKLFKMNKVAISWDRIYSTFPEDENKDETREYTISEIRKMLDHSRTIDKVLILLATSSGIRAGAFNFQWKHLHPVYLYNGRYCWEEQDVTESVTREGKVVCALIKIYANSSSEYFAFTTPECWQSVQAYRETWIKETGREPEPEDPFFKRIGSPFVHSLDDIGIRKRMQRIVKEAGLRPPLPVGSRRHAVPLFNGFRRYFNKANKKALEKGSMLASLILKENMMGHTGLIKLDKNYFKAHVSELIEEYIQAVPNLTISDTERQKAVIKKQETEIHALRKKDARIDELEYIIQKKDQEVDQKINDIADKIAEMYDMNRKRANKNMDKIDAEFNNKYGTPKE